MLLSVLLLLDVLPPDAVLYAQQPQAQQRQPPQPALHLENPALAEAERLTHAGQFPQAERAWREALRAQPQNPDALYGLAYCLLRQNRPADALHQYTAAAALRAPNSEQLVQVGQAYVLLQDEADADRWTLDAVRLDPTDAQAWYSLGRIRYTDQKFASAAACFQQVLKLSPRNVKAENNLGLAYEGQNRTEDALAAYRQAVAWQRAQPPQQASEQPLLNLAILLLHRGSLAEAEPLLVEARALAPGDPRIHEQLGHLYLQQGNFASAATEFAAAVSEDPRSSSLHFLLGQALRRMGRMAEAQQEFAASAQLAHPDAGAASH